MIPEPITKLLAEIAGKVGGGCIDHKKEAEEDPEKCLTSLLLTINDRVTDRTNMLNSSIEYAFYSGTLKEAQQFLHQHKS
ncbi:MAG: hypothetical protein A3B25_01355 [Candidatus Ryanbacteria bacterium RIFCSPLOWO2_01_FULL_48_26]|uniref:Uncharacterized protein n=1 Tax=Candidatus Ryanbacteria bacterium RIFCSPLOWO2_01_FULL_48_26 TaxID=1802126 RepID=A0A1G2GU07_9BACT|nr:MAG: hypothetical protein A3B25_01355 [Candidatus Ryanbacteria bacterium RIFCSPLOWO2_01_FULL_48_26]